MCLVYFCELWQMIVLVWLGRVDVLGVGGGIVLPETIFYQPIIAAFLSLEQ